MGIEKEPTRAGGKDPAERQPRRGGPLQPDPDAAAERIAESPDPASAQPEGQARAASGPEHAEPAESSRENVPPH